MAKTTADGKGPKKACLTFAKKISLYIYIYKISLNICLFNDSLQFYFSKSQQLLEGSLYCKPRPLQ